MKKILISIPLIFVMCLSIIPVFSVYADAPIYNIQTDGETEESFMARANNANIDFDGNFFFFSSSYDDWSQIPQSTNVSFWWFYLNLDSSYVTSSESNGIYHWTWTNTTETNCPFYGSPVMYSTVGSGTIVRQGVSSQWSNIKGVVLDLYYNSNTGDVYTSTGWQNFTVGDSNISQSIKQQHLMLDGLDFDPDALRVHVDTGNQLSGEFTIDNTDLFSVNVSNQGNTDIQWLFAIVERGTNVTFDFDRELSAADIVNHSSNIKYLLLRGEDCLLPAGQYESLPYTSLSQVGGVYTDYITARVQTSFHHLGAGDSDSCHIYWEMVDLKPNTQYDCVAYAMKTYSNYTTYLMSLATNNLDMADTETLTEVFRQSFTISNPKKYDSTVSLGGYGGIIANNGETDYSSVHSDILGFTDSGGTYYDYRGTYNGVNFNSQTAGSSSKFNSLVSQSNGALKLFGAVMGYFPPELLQLIQLGFLAIVIVAIIKRVS